MKIDFIETGKSFSGRQAVIHAPKTLGEGVSLSALTEFLQARGLQASPGYEDEHVLRIYGFDNDEAFHSLLTVDFPLWQQQRYPEREPIDIPASVTLMPLDTEKEPVSPTPAALAKTVSNPNFWRQNSTALTGLLGSLSGLMIMLSTRSGKKEVEAEKADTAGQGLKRFASACFMAASALLGILGVRASQNRSVNELIESPGHASANQTIVDTARQHIEHALDTMQRHPWEISSFFNGLGNLSLLTSALRGRVPTEIAGSLAGLTSMALIAGVPERGNKTLLGLERPADHTADRWDRLFERLETRLPALAPLAQGLQSLKNKVFENNMKYAGYVGIGNTLALTASGLVNNPTGEDNRPMLAVLPLSLAAGYLTSLSSKGFGHGIDRIASDAAAHIACRLKETPALMDNIQQEIRGLAQRLAAEPREISATSRDIRRAVAAKLQLDHGIAANADRQFIQDYQHMLRLSPFTPHV